MHCRHCRHLLLILLLCLLSFLFDAANAGCPSDQYYGVSSCSRNAQGNMYWSCKPCTANAIQYCYFQPPYGTPAFGECLDEVCVCKKGFYATSPWYTCGPNGQLSTVDYAGNEDGGPPFEEQFMCTPCPPGNYCPGGADVKVVYTVEGYAKWRGYRHKGSYVCPYPYMHANLQGNGCFCPPFTTDLAMINNIRGCGCPPGEFWNRSMTASDLFSFWNSSSGRRNIWETFWKIETDGASSSYPWSRFWEAGKDDWPTVEMTEIMEKFLRSNPVTCSICPAGAYCEGGHDMKLCPKGWETIGNGKSKLYECSKCALGVCPAGTYCRAPTMEKMEFSCAPCPAGFMCVSQDAGAVKCPAGSYQDQMNMTYCKQCARGTASAREARIQPCDPCAPGWYQPETGQSICLTCSKGKFQPSYGGTECKFCPQGTYQPDNASTTCISCPPGYAMREETTQGHTSLLGACQICGPGYYTSLKRMMDEGIPIFSCVKCPPGKYNPFPGQSYCIQCPGSDLYVTSVPGATSVSQCVCDSTKSYTQTGTGLCLPCSTCGKGTYMSSTECSEELAAMSSSFSSISKCTACKTCLPMSYVHPDFFCTGAQSRDKQQEGCMSCRVECFSGASSLSGNTAASSWSKKVALVHPCYSGTGSVDTSMCMEGFSSIHQSSCEDGYFLSPFSRFSTTIPPPWQILPNANSRFFAVMDPFNGVVEIWESKSLDDAIVQRDDSTVVVIQYTHPSSGSAGANRRLLASIVWSLDGRILYVVRMDAAIVMMQVLPEEYRQTKEQWSFVDQYNSAEKPYSAQDASPSVPVCVTLPQQPSLLQTGQQTAARRQIALICTFDSGILPSSRSAYLVRIQTDGTRLFYEEGRAPYAGVSLLYDVSLNVIYWTIFATWSIPYSHDTEKKSVMRIVLDPSYDIDYMEPMFQQQMQQTQQLQFPLGISMQAASIEPESNILYAYLCYNGNEARLFKLPIAASETSTNKQQREESFLPLDRDQDLHGRVGPVLASMEIFPSSKCSLPAKFFFTLHGRLFFQMPFDGIIRPGVNDVFMAGMCKPCPYGLTSDGSIAISEDMCRY